MYFRCHFILGFLSFLFQDLEEFGQSFLEQLLPDARQAPRRRFFPEQGAQSNDWLGADFAVFILRMYVIEELSGFSSMLSCGSKSTCELTYLFYFCQFFVCKVRGDVWGWFFFFGSMKKRWGASGGVWGWLIFSGEWRSVSSTKQYPPQSRLGQAVCWGLQSSMLEYREMPNPICLLHFVLLYITVFFGSHGAVALVRMFELQSPAARNRPQRS